MRCRRAVKSIVNQERKKGTILHLFFTIKSATTILQNALREITFYDLFTGAEKVLHYAIGIKNEIVHL